MLLYENFLRYVSECFVTSFSFFYSLTVCIAEGWDFEIRLPGGNAQMELDD